METSLVSKGTSFGVFETVKAMELEPVDTLFVAIDLKWKRFILKNRVSKGDKLLSFF